MWDSTLAWKHWWIYLAGSLMKEKVNLQDALQMPSLFHTMHYSNWRLCPSSEDPVSGGTLGPYGSIRCILRFQWLHKPIRKSVYPSTVVGIPPCEMHAPNHGKRFPGLSDCITAEIEDFHMPQAGLPIILLLWKIIRHTRQGKKVIGSLLGAGQICLQNHCGCERWKQHRIYRELILHII